MSYHEYTIEVSGLTFRVEYERDDYQECPWDRECGHGPVSDWEWRDKKPGELVLCEDRRSKRFYDFAGACRIARRDGWDAKPYNTGNETARQQAAKAARADFKRMRAWCNNEWVYVGVIVKLLDDEGEETGEEKSVWGIESDAKDYLDETARELAEGLAENIRKVSDYRREGRMVSDAMIDSRSV